MASSKSTLHSLPVSPITTHSTRRTHLAPFCLGCEGHVHGVSPNTLWCKAYISILYYLELYKLSYQRSSPAQTVLDSHNLSPSSDYSHTITPRPRPPTGELENGSRQFLPVQSHSTPRCARMSQSLSHMSLPHVSLTCLPRQQCRHPCKALCSEGRSASIREDIPQSAISNHRPVSGGGAASGTGCAGGGVPPPGGASPVRRRAAVFRGVRYCWLSAGTRSGTRSQYILSPPHPYRSKTWIEG